jgi:uncharacterized protein (TIGR02594 family)
MVARGCQWGTLPKGQKVSAPSWYMIAKAEIGVLERHGEANNPRILEYLATTHRDVGGNLGTWGVSRDSTPWCSAFVNWCLIEAGCQVTTNDARAISWLDWGFEIEEPEQGCIAVLRRKAPAGHDPATGSSSGNHVAFFDKIVPRRGVRLLGGNQSNSVRFTTYGKRYNVLSYRLPKPEYWAVPSNAA